MRKAEIKFEDRTAGWLSQNEEGYHFLYDGDYLASDNPHAVSLTLPLQEEAYSSKTMFPFFDGLIPEGWLLDIAEKNWKLNPRDRMGLLLICCQGLHRRGKRPSTHNEISYGRTLPVLLSAIVGRGEYLSRPLQQKMFGSVTPPILPYDETELEALALTVVRNHVTIPGVQPKLSLHLGRPEKDWNRSDSPLWAFGEYILKPPSPSYPQLPEIEDLTMHMAETVKIRTVPHCLIRMRSGALAYITRRIDRPKNGKVHMEDMCQLTERLTEDKYHGSYEQIAKAIRRYSLNPGLDVIDFYEMVAFSFLTGNSDMHLKNFSLLDVGGMSGTGYSLAPAYDMLATGLVNPADTEELALTLNGKKSQLRPQDFQRAWSTSQVDTKVQERMLKKFQNAMPAWEQLIANSFLGQGMKAAYLELIHAKFSQLGL